MSLKLNSMNVPPFSLTEQLSELGGELENAVLEVLRSGQYIGGERVRKFEYGFASRIGTPFSVGCNSGTDALILALRGLGIGPGDEVITCSFSFFATAEAITAVGATPVFVDVVEDTYLMDLDQVEKAITQYTKALIPVHLFGRPVDMERVCSIATRNKLKVIEDCAQACGASWRGRAVGSWGDVGCFSFFPTKNLGGAGDGGAVTCKDKELAQCIRELAVHGMPRRYLHTRVGYNSRLDAIQAAVLDVKLKYVEGWVEKRRSIANVYSSQLKDLDLFNIPDDGPSGHSWNQYVIRISPCRINSHCKSTCIESEENAHLGLPGARCRDWLKNYLQDKGITTIVYYPIPIHLQPAYSHLNIRPGDLPVTERLCSEVLSLPIFPAMSFDAQSYVIEQLKKVALI